MLGVLDRGLGLLDKAGWVGEQGLDDAVILLDVGRDP